MSSEVSDLPAIEIGEIDLFLDTITGLDFSETSRAEFYDLLTSRLPRILRASSGQVFVGVDDQLGLIFSGPKTKKVRLEKSVRHEIELWTKEEIVSKTETRVLSSPSGIEDFFVLCRPEGQTQLLFRLCFDRSIDQRSRQIFEDLIEEIGNFIVEFETQKGLTNTKKRLVEIESLSKTLRILSNSKGYRQLCYNLVNEVAHATLADRVCFFHQNGKLLAASGVAVVSTKSPVVKRFRPIIRKIARLDAAVLVLHGEVMEQVPLKFKAQLAQFAEETSSIATFYLKLRNRERTLGILTLEYFGEKDVDVLEINRKKENCLRVAAPAFDTIKQLHSVPFLNLWFRLSGLVLNRPLKNLLFLSLFLLASWFLYSNAITETDFEINGSGILKPTIESKLFAPEKGTVSVVKIGYGDMIDLESPLYKISSDEISEQKNAIQGQIGEALERLNVLKISEASSEKLEGSSLAQSLERSALSSKILQEEIVIRTLNRRMELIRKREKSLRVFSPVKGQVTTRNVKSRLLNKPVERGEELLTISRVDGDWEVQLLVDATKMKYLVNQLETNGQIQVRMRLSSAPTQEIIGIIKQLDSFVVESLTDGARNLQVDVEIEEEELRELLRTGTTVEARIQCGRRSYAFLYSYELVDKVRRFFFL